MRIAASGVLATLLAVSGSEAVAACSPSAWQEEYSGESLGGRLEKLYSSLLQSCSIARMERETDRLGDARDGCRKESISSVPRVLQRNLPMSRDVVWNERQSIGRAFALLYPTQAHFGAQTGESSEFLLYSEGLAGPGLIPDATSRFGYVHDCGSIVNLAASSDSNLKVPVASFAAGLKTGYSGSRKTNLVLAKGRFESPLWSKWSSQGPDRLQAALVFFGWYARHAERREDHYQVLSALPQAVSLFYVDEETRNASGEMSTSIDLNVPLFKVGFTANAKVDEATNASARTFMVGAIDPPEFRSLPRPAQVVDAIAEYSASSDAGAIDVVPGTTVQHFQTLVGVPAFACNQSAPGWKVSGEPRELSLISATPETTAAGTPLCRFGIQYTAPAELADPKAPLTVALNYRLEYVKPIQDAEGKFHFARVKAAQVVHTINRSPEIFVSDANVASTLADSGADGPSRTWKTGLVFRDSTVPKAVDWLADPVPDLSVRCPGSPAPIPLKGRVDLNRNQLTGTLFMIQVANSSGEYESWKAVAQGAGWTRCEVEGSITFKSSTAGRSLPRPFRTSITVPVRQAGEP